jgi:serine/threonine protein kinase
MLAIMDFRTRYQYNPKTDFIDKGGFARVFKAYDNMLDRQVALKVYSQGASSKYDLITEIKKVWHLEHPNLCRYYDVAILEGTTAIGEEEILQIGVMEYLDGGDIKRYLKDHPRYLSKLLTDVLQGLSFLHASGIIHRDLTPTNILIKKISSAPIAKITDFGISKVMDAVSPKSSELLGKVEYMAPEQFNPRKYGINGKISNNLDLWSFGCLTYELIKDESFFW